MTSLENLRKRVRRLKPKRGPLPPLPPNHHFFDDAPHLLGGPAEGEDDVDYLFRASETVAVWDGLWAKARTWQRREAHRRAAKGDSQ